MIEPPEQTAPGQGPATPRVGLRRPFGASCAAAAVAFGLCVPLIAWRTQPDQMNALVLASRWRLVVVIVALAFIARLLLAQLRRRGARGLALAGAAIAAWALWRGLTQLSPPLSAALFGVLGLCLALCAVALDRRPDKADASVRPVARPRFDEAQRARAVRIGKALCLVALFVFPIVASRLLGPAGSLKWVNNYGIQILIYVMLGWGLNIVVGLAGLLDLGYVAFYAVGAYTYALLSTVFGLSFWICLPLAGLFAACWGVALGFPVLRLRGDYLAIVTLAFGEIIRVVLLNWTDLTNGAAGISSIPRITFFGLPFTPGPSGFAAHFGLTFSPTHRIVFLFYLILCLALATNWIALRLRRLPIGRAWEALREDEIACRALGIDTVKTKMTAFALGACFAGLAGSFFAVRESFVSPDSFTFMESATILAIVVLGGMGSQFGVAAAAALMIGGTEVLRELGFLKMIFGPDFDPVQYRMLIFGFAMAAMMVWRPRGLVSKRSPSIVLGKTTPIAKTTGVAADVVGQGRA